MEDYNGDVEVERDDCAYYKNRGWTYHALKDTTNALADLERAIALNPDQAYAAYLNRAWIYGERGEYQLALDDCNHVLKLGIKDEAAYAYRARIYCWQGDHEQALADCERALALDPECDDAYGVRGLVSYEQQQYERALA